MKKIFASLLFLLFMSVSSNAFATCAGTVNCGNVSTGNCTATLSGGVCQGGATCATPATPVACSTLSDANCRLANNVNAGCGLLVTGDANNNAFVDTMCRALKIVTGSGGKAFAAFAIISVGIGFFTGKVSWGLMIGITAGIAAMFGAPTIVAAISGESALDCGS